MDAAIGAATGLVGSVVNLLCNQLVEAYVASAELGLNSDKIKEDLLLTQGLLHEAQRRGISNNPGLEGLLQRLGAKADQAEDALDELHYFIIRDQLDGTRHAVPDLGDDLRGHARHGHHALRHTVGNCLACFSCSPRTQDDDDSAAAAAAAAAAVASNPCSVTKADSGGNYDTVEKLTFDRVAMSKKIKSIIEEIHSLCESVSELLKITPHHNTTPTVNPRQRITGSTITQDTLYGRRDIFDKTIHNILSSATDQGQALSVLPVVGPGGIGKTTFTQHLYNDKRVEEHFDVRVWVCVSTDFDVLKLSQQILGCIPGCNNSNQTTNLAELQTSISHMLKSKRFFLVFDDIWECNSEGWETLLAPFRKGGAKGSMVLVTTRFPSKAEMVKTTSPIALKPLEFDDFLPFFKTLIFEGNEPEYCQEDLDDLASDIAKKLKGSPLAGKTVGRLLRKEISRKHWQEVLENNKWQKQEDDDCIMTSLRISYDYLPFHLKKCFSYFALFPEDYKFKNLEITYFWIAMGIIEKDEDYMEQLVENGFLVKENDHLSNQQYYVLHDLLHKLSEDVSSQECLNIYDSARFRADVVPKSIRHLSITMEDKYDGKFSEEMIKLRNKINIAKLRSLMIFRYYGETTNEIVKDTFKDIKGLRVLFILVNSPNSFPYNFSKLIHLQCLKIKTRAKVTLPSTLSGFYQLKLLDLSGWKGSVELPKDINRLINLHHFIAGGELHSSVAEVGKMKCLKELKEFHVKKESVGYELVELGELSELAGDLTIYNLENVATKEEAMTANLVSKGDLRGLRLVWGESVVIDGTTKLFDVLDALQPHPNLEALSITNPGATTGPSWLCGDINFQLLQFLHLEGVSWITLPPFEQFPHLTSLMLRNIYKVSEISHVFGGTTNRSFLQLKQIILDSLPELIEWVGVPNGSFSRLETIYCSSCPNLRMLPFLQECSAGCYSHLTKLEIFDCPKLSLPPMPHSSSLIDCNVSHGSTKLTYYAGKMDINGYSGELAWHNLQEVRRLCISRCSLACGGLQDLACLQSLTVKECGNLLWCPIETAHTTKPLPASLERFDVEGESSLQSMALLSSLTCLTDLVLVDCENLTVHGFNPLITVNLNSLKIYNRGDCLSRSISADLFSELVAARTNLILPAGSFQLRELTVDCISAVLVAPICSLLAATVHTIEFWYDQRAESFTEEEDRAIQLLTSLHFISFMDCPNLLSLPQGLNSLPSLKTLFVQDCPKIQFLPKGEFPTSLECLFVEGCSTELQEQAKKLKGTEPDFNVILEVE